MKPFLVEFLTRSGCHLCDEARPIVTRATRWSGGHLSEVDIDEEDDLVRDFGLRIPVVRVGGEVVAEGRIESVVVLWRAMLALRFSPVRR